MKTCKNNYKLPGAFISWNQIKIGLKLALKKIFTIIKTKLLKNRKIYWYSLKIIKPFL